MSDKRVIWTNPDGSMSVLIPAPGVSMERVMQDVPQNALSVEVVDVNVLPKDRFFRKAWKQAGKSCVEDLEKSREVAHEFRRALREEEFEPHDKIVMLQLPGAEEAEAARETIRQKYAVLQTKLDGASSVEELKGLLK